MISIQLPDGSKREFEHAGDGGRRGRVDRRRPGQGRAGRPRRQGRRCARRRHQLPIDHDAPLAIVTDKDADGLDVIRHSTAHLLAYAVKELFPEAQVTIGPVIENGFYYDFAYKRPFTPEDLVAIEAKMTELAKKDEPVTRRVLPRDEAVAYFKSMGEHYKAEIIASIPADEDVSLYREGASSKTCAAARTCRAPASCAHFKLMKVAGAYWRGDHRNEMLQRIYGTAWATKDDLQQYLHMLEEAEKRDHRKLGKRAGPVPHARASARAWCSGIPRAGRCGRSSSSTCARVPRQRLPGSEGPADPRQGPVGEASATGTTTATTCSRPNRRSATTR
jgi:threonyl-tRNA synthetase